MHISNELQYTALSIPKLEYKSFSKTHVRKIKLLSYMLQVDNVTKKKFIK